eukprot:TRINITY_DN24541_c0_g1_i2.p1 TRINITY_DN24541_c0_g1~~TRINITY_DN24541_c0_g1_i2.p1  ORF type:complete len:512 (+),score=62.35 TRINITY_DN24541_c0_g1_i2:66-1601(+)
MFKYGTACLCGAAAAGVALMCRLRRQHLYLLLHRRTAAPQLTSAGDVLCSYQHAHEADAIHKQLGPVVGVFAAGRYHLLVSDAALLSEVLSKTASYTTDGDAVGSGLQRYLIWLHGDEWRRIRGVCLRSFVAHGTPQVHASRAASVLVPRLVQALREHNAADSTQTLFARAQLSSWLEYICGGMGSAVPLHGGKPRADSADSLSEAYDALLAGVSWRSEVPTALWWMWWLQQNRDLKKAAAVLQTAVRERLRTAAPDCPLGVLRAAVAEGALTEAECVDNVCGFGLAAHDGSVLSAVLSHLLRAPAHVLASVRDEVTAAGADAINMAASRKLPTLSGAVDEALRLSPPIPLFVRRAVCNTTVGGFAVPQGTALHFNVAWFAVRTELWGEDAAQFKASRFDGPGVTYREPLYLTFGTGPRRCMGQPFIVAHARAAVAGLVGSMSDEELAVCIEADARVRPPSASEGVCGRCGAVSVKLCDLSAVDPAVRAMWKGEGRPCYTCLGELFLASDE